MPKSTVKKTQQASSLAAPCSPLKMAFDAERADKRNYIIKRGKRVLMRLTADEVMSLRENTFYLHGE